MQELLLALAKGLLDKLAATLFEKLFGERTPEEYFQEIIDAIKEYLHIEIVSNDITLIRGTLDGIISQMTIDYPNKKKSGATDQELIDFLTPIEASLDQNVMGPLEALTDEDQAKGNAQQSLLVYVIGGGMQFGVLQEMALHDPANLSDPSKSQYALDIQQYAKKYRQRADHLLDAIRTKRFAAISQVQCMGRDVNLSVPLPDPPSDDRITAGWPSGVKTYTFSVHDGWTGQDVCRYSEDGSIWYPCDKSLSAYGKSVDCRKSYVDDQTKAFDQTWSATKKVLDSWKALQHDPLPS